MVTKVSQAMRPAGRLIASCGQCKQRVLQ
jgi:hypothetical protein